MDAWRRLRRIGDGLVAITLTALVQAEAWLLPAPDPDEVPTTAILNGPIVASVAALAFTLSLAWRRRAPLVVLVLAFPAVALSRVASLDATIVLTMAVMLATYSAGAHTRGRPAVLAAGGVAGLIALTAMRATVGVEEPGDILVPLSLLGGPWLAGLAIRERRDREVVLEERATILERERAEQARAAAAEERARIAREMHDIVAHAMSVIVLQARGARRALADDPEATRTALEAIESTSSGALAEMRQLLGVLREGSAPLAPEPGLAELDALVDQLRDAGLDVEVDIDGVPTDLPPSLDRAAYRILQEALTNVLRHARVRRATVSVDYRPERLEITVRDTGSPASAPTLDGRGITGMRERAASLGGTLEAGPEPGGGFTVRASIPVSAASP